MGRSIRTRLIVSFIVLAVTPLLLLGLVFGVRSIDILQNQAIAAQQQEASEISVRVSDLLNTPIQRMQMLIQVDGLGIVDQPQQQTLVNELMSFDHSLNELAVLDTSGKEQVRVTRRAVLGQADLRDQSQSDEFTLPKQSGAMYFSSVYLDPATGEPLMTAAIPMFNLRTGNLSGILVGAIRFRPVWDLIATLSVNRTDTIYIVDSTGKIVAHRDPSVVLKSTRFSVPAQPGTGQGLNGDSVILAFQEFQFGAQSFVVMAEKPFADAFALAINQTLATIVLVIIALLVAVAFGVLTVQRFVQPIVALSTTAGAISAGDLTRRVTVASNDEIGTLGKAFNSMTTQLAQTLDGLRRNIADLEFATRERERLIVELREASRLKSEFLSTMSHELRTPLNAMLGFTGILLAGIGGSIDEDAQHMIERVEANSKRLLSIINDVLDISKIEAGRMELVETPLALRSLTAQWQTQIEVLAKEKGLTFETTVESALPETVLLDREKVTRIAINLLSNAIKFTEKGSVKLALRKQESLLIFQVTDTGIGIPPHAIQFIFDEFRQVDGSTRRVYGGTGLGLAIVRKLCLLMNGNVSVTSTLGEGSTFTVQLPIKLPEAAPVAVLPVAIVASS